MELKDKLIENTKDFLKNRLRGTIINAVNHELEPTRIRINLMKLKYKDNQELIKDLNILLDDLDLK
jgi:ribosomal protein L12E/L44/L45/RPP1/RPP2